MPAEIRKATPEDAPLLLDLLRAALGEEHPARQVLEPSWIQGELQPESGHRTMIAVDGGRAVAAITILDFDTGTAAADMAQTRTPKHAYFANNPVCNLGRNLFLPESFGDGAAGQLVKQVAEIAGLRKQMAIVRVLASDNRQQVLFENEGFVCVGFQPDKHFHRTREEILYYVKPARAIIGTRVALSQSLPQISELATAAMTNLHIPGTMSLRDGGTGYPLQTDVEFLAITDEKYAEAIKAAQALNPPREISGGFNSGHGFMRVAGKMPTRAFVARRQNEVVGGVRFLFDELDRCVRVMDAFCTDDLSLGALFHQLIKISHAELNAFYVEVDVLLTSVRLLISAEQLGFVPVAYFPGIFKHAEGNLDIVKMVKYNQNFAIEQAVLTAHAEAIFKVVSDCLKDQTMGVAIVNLLRDLTLFKGLGDGELRKLGRLFTQKLFKPGEHIFQRDDAGNEAYVVMRGEVEILLDEKGPSLAKLGQGQVIGELAFLDGSVRGALAIARQPTILLIISRHAFFELIQREPNLGLAVMKNIALELGNRVRKMNAALESAGGSKR